MRNSKKNNAIYHCTTCEFLKNCCALCCAWGIYFYQTNYDKSFLFFPVSTCDLIKVYAIISRNSIIMEMAMSCCVNTSVLLKFVLLEDLLYIFESFSSSFNLKVMSCCLETCLLFIQVVNFIFVIIFVTFLRSSTKNCK